MKYISVISFIMLCMCGCDDGINRPNNRNAEALSATEITSITISGRSVAFTVRCMVGSPEYAFVRADEIINNTTVMYKIYGADFSDAIYVDWFYFMEAPITFKAPSPGTYTFRFMKNSETSVDTTLTIK